MEIKKEIKKEEVKIEIQVAHYSEQDIKMLICADLVKQGFDVDDVTFQTSYKYVTDEWGMNGYTTSYFTGAMAKVHKQGEQK